MLEIVLKCDVTPSVDRVGEEQRLRKKIVVQVRDLHQSVFREALLPPDAANRHQDEAARRLMRSRLCRGDNPLRHGRGYQAE